MPQEHKGELTIYGKVPLPRFDTYVLMWCGTFVDIDVD